MIFVVYSDVINAVQAAWKRILKSLMNTVFVIPPSQAKLAELDYWHRTEGICMQQADTVHIATVALPACP